MYTVNPESYGSVFVLPKNAAALLKLASGAFVKALVFAFSRAGEPLTPEAVAEGAGLSADDAADALLFWTQKGFLKDLSAAEAAPAAPAEAAAPAPEAPAQKAAIDVRPSKPSYEMICKRMDEDENVRALFGEAQMKLGRTIGTADQASLLLLYDYYGLPIEVILAICEYARLNKKGRNMGYIYTMGMDWSRRGIDSLEAADEEFKRLGSVNENWSLFARAVGLKAEYPTAAQQKYLSTWMDDWRFSPEMLALAYEETLKNAGKASFPYMHKILAAWRAAGVDTPEKAAAREKQFREESLDRAAKKRPAAPAKPAGKGAPAYEGPASYDIDRAEQRMNTTVPKLKKKEKR